LKVGLNCCQNTLYGKTEQVKEFGYLVSMITSSAKCHMEIKRWIVIEETFSKRKELLVGIRRNG